MPLHFLFSQHYLIFQNTDQLFHDGGRYHIETSQLICGANDKDLRHERVKDIHIEKAPSKETPVITISTNMGIGFAGTTNQLFLCS